MMRIARLLSMDRGSALLVGVGGSGKQSLTRLAAYIVGAFTFQIQSQAVQPERVVRGSQDHCTRSAGLKGQKVAFIFTDAEVKEESFLEYINQILMTGEVAGLFPKDELDMIVNDMRPWPSVSARTCPTRGRTSTSSSWVGCGTTSTRASASPRLATNSRLELEISRVSSTGAPSTGSSLGPRTPSSRVSTKYIGDFDMACDESVKALLQEHMGHVHTAVTTACKEYFEKFRRNVYVTPKSYLSFIDGYRSLYQKKLDDVNVLADKINSGLSQALRG